MSAASRPALLISIGTSFISLHVVKGFLQQRRVIPKQAQCPVALIAQQASDVAAVVAMINAQRLLLMADSAYPTRLALQILETGKG
jgi:hypothetical protein